MQQWKTGLKEFYNYGMKKIIIIPDSFKGTLSSEQVIEIIAGCLKRRFPDWQIRGIPVADGGEGSVRAMMTAIGGSYLTSEVCGPYREKMEAVYGIKDNTAVVEVASCAGLPLVKDRKNPALTTTYGVGQQILQACRHGADKIIVGLGGSCSNDGGCGLAAALGVRFTDARGNEFVPVGDTLKDIEHVDVSHLLIDTGRVKITAMCDIDNPLYGTTGAAYIYGPQKGADPEMVRYLDEGLRHLHEVVLNDLGIDINIPGAGAAGGIGGGLYGFLNAEMKMGIDVVLDTAGFEQLLSDTDLVITGEGCFDEQSLNGKVVCGIAQRCKKHNVECIAVVGMMKEISRDIAEIGLKAVYPTVKEKQPANMGQAVENLIRCVDSIEF